MIEAVAQRGYPETRVADVVEGAGAKDLLRPLRRQAGLLPRRLRPGLGEAVRRRPAAFSESPDAPWAERMRAATAALLELLASWPEEARFAIVEVLAAGPKALVRRDAALRRFSELVDVGRSESSIELRDHLRGDRRRGLRVALQRDPARRYRAPAGAAARHRLLDHPALPGPRGAAAERERARQSPSSATDGVPSA